MTTIEIILLIVGMLFILGSFWVTEKLSPDELERISELSREEMEVILDHELESSRQRIEQMVDKTIDASKERTERSLEKQTNEKIMAINEYSDTVIEKMNKTHNEIMFLYSMLNDKHTELTDFSNGLSQKLQQLKEQEEELTNHYMEQLRQYETARERSAGRTYAAPAAADEKPQQPPKPKPKQKQQPKPAEPQEAQVEDAVPAPQEEPENVDEEERNVREEIFRLYEEGKDSVAIARKLRMGVGEVRLILGLYKGDYSGEV